MKKIFSLAILAASALTLMSCTQGPKVNNPETFRKQTGVIGVFRQAATFCSEGLPQTMKLGDSTILVKPTWSNDQDNIFFSTMKPGPATLYSYHYQCWKDEFNLKLDQSDPSTGAVPTTVVIPDSGFCKIVISFVGDEKLFTHNDLLIEEVFDRWNVAVPPASIPYCNIVDSQGGEVSFANKDSLVVETFKSAIQQAASTGSDQIQPLISLDTLSDMVTWNGDRSKILLVVWHNDPERFQEGRKIKLGDEVLWTVADKEFRKWFNQNKTSVRNWTRRLHQLMGYSFDTTLTYFSTVWVDPKDVVRPAYVPDPTSNVMRASFADDNSGEESVASYEPATEESAESPFGKKDEAFMIWFQNWFDETAAKYEKKSSKRLWTRLGYTYDWSYDTPTYGLSEFIVVRDAEVLVNFTKQTKAFLNWLNSEM
ncbi:MAG: hypothetical protein IKR75_00450 [Fibrobacter sp.]|nr:hypothetical protein [Fibrobacter sp.]MBR6316877.1 hypothetical protein [Fibrobacter sp.]